MTDVRLTATNPDDSSVVPVACNSKGELKLEEPPTFDGNLDGDLTVSGGATFGDGILISSDTTSSYFAQFYCGGNHVLFIEETADTGGVPPVSAILRIGKGGPGRSIAASGSAEFAGDVVSGANPNVQANNGVELNPAGYVFARRGPTDSIFLGADTDAAGANVAIYGNGTAYFGGDINGGSPAISLESNGSAEFAGDVIVGSRGSKWMIVESGGLAHLIEQSGQAKDSKLESYPQLRNIPNELTMVEQALAEVMEKLRMVPPAGWDVWDGSSENS